MKMRLFLIAGEASGDQLGAGLMRALALAEPEVAFSGIGGPAMQAAGLSSLFPLEDLAVMGVVPVLKRLPLLLARLDEAVGAVRDVQPDALIIIDSPDFTHRVARRCRRFLPKLPIIDYVSPTVWAWRQGRARKMRAYIDHVLALLPFEPAAYRRLDGPPCSYVGHPLIERLDVLKPREDDLRRRNQDPPLLLLLPGSRHSEIARLMPIFKETLARVSHEMGVLDVVLPAVPHLAEEIASHIAAWPVKPVLVQGEAEKFASFRRARAALAASGTVTLELALAEVPQIVAYRVSPLETLLRPFIKVPSIVLPNLILGENAVPEFLQEACMPEALTSALVGLLRDGPEREQQIAAFPKVTVAMALPGGETPSARAASIVLSTAKTRQKS